MFRRKFIKNSLLSIPFLSSGNLFGISDEPLKIGLAQWSLNKSINSGKLDNLDFARVAKEQFGIDVVEYVNQFFHNKAKNKSYLSELRKRSNGIGVRNLLIMIDNEGNLGESNYRKRTKAVENHKKWVEAAQFIGCDHIRVNAAGRGSESEVSKYASESLFALGEFSKPFGIDVIVENHGGYSSDARWLVDVIKKSKLNNIGTLPDFGNFCIRSKPEQLSDWGALEGCAVEYDKYKGVQELLPFARSVSAKSINFDDEGNCIEIDFFKMMKIVKNFGYGGYVSIEYEGTSHSEMDGIALTKRLMKKAWEVA